MIYNGDALTMLKTLPDESVHCCVNKGRFKKGQHWRKPQPYWNYDVKPWAKHPELRFDKENLITLCQNCHKEQHRR